MQTSCEMALKWMSQKPHNKVNIGLSNGLLPDGTKPLPGPMLAQIYIAT